MKTSKYKEGQTAAIYSKPGDSYSILRDPGPKWGGGGGGTRGTRSCERRHLWVKTADWRGLTFAIGRERLVVPAPGEGGCRLSVRSGAGSQLEDNTTTMLSGCPWKESGWWCERLSGTTAVSSATRHGHVGHQGKNMLDIQQGEKHLSHP